MVSRDDTLLRLGRVLGLLASSMADRAMGRPGGWPASSAEAGGFAAELEALEGQGLAQRCSDEWWRLTLAGAELVADLLDGTDEAETGRAALVAAAEVFGSG